MSAGSFAFAILLVGCGICLQAGSYVAMIKRGTELLSGHGQFQHPGWLEDAKMEDVIENPDMLKALALQVPGVTAAAVRVQGSGLIGNSDTLTRRARLAWCWVWILNPNQAYPCSRRESSKAATFSREMRPLLARRWHAI